MRTIVVELYGPELLERIEQSAVFRRLRVFEVLRVLRYDRNEFVAICRVTPKDPRMRPEDCFRGDPVRTQVHLLKREESSSIVVVERSLSGPGPRLPGRSLFGYEVTKPGAGYLFGPPSYRDGVITFSFAGNTRQLHSILSRARARGLRYRVLSLKVAEFAISPLERLTERQREVLRAAYAAGYYDVPRRISSAQLGRELGVRAATVVEHLRKSEKRLLDTLLRP